MSGQGTQIVKPLVHTVHETCPTEQKQQQERQNTALSRSVRHQKSDLNYRHNCLPLSGVVGQLIRTILYDRVNLCSFPFVAGFPHTFTSVTRHWCVLNSVVTCTTWTTEAAVSSNCSLVWLRVHVNNTCTL